MFKTIINILTVPKVNVDRAKKEEGFRPNVYKDKLGKDTILYGTLLPFTKEEGELILRHRMSKKINEIQDLLKGQPTSVREVLIDMSYQLGSKGLRNFKKMLPLIKSGEYLKASVEIKDSLYYKQTPKRCMRNSKLLKETK
jgi:GH24 family phage-related lysozyme (muramidase)